MNERIRALLNESGLQPYYDAQQEQIEKFAELLIRQCMHLVKDCYSEGSQYLTVCASTIIEDHFGVEETKGWVCPRCGVDRTKNVCPKGYTATIEGKCPMIAVTQ